MSEQTFAEEYARIAPKAKQLERTSVEEERSTFDVWKEKLDVKLRPDEVKITAPDGSADFTAINEGGEMFISTHLTDGEGNRLSEDMPRYGEMFTAALDYFNKSGRGVDKIIGDWGGKNNTNLHEFVRVVGEQIGNPEITIQEIYRQQKDIPEAVLVKAALQAPTGKVVSKAGFGRPVVNVGRGDVQVLFEKQETNPKEHSVQGMQDISNRNREILKNLAAGSPDTLFQQAGQSKAQEQIFQETKEAAMSKEESVNVSKVVEDLDTIIAKMRQKPDLYKAVESMPGWDREILLQAVGKYMNETIPTVYLDEDEARKIGATIDTRFVVAPAGIAIVTRENGAHGLITAEMPEDNTQRIQAAVDAIIRWSELHQHNVDKLSEAMQNEHRIAMNHVMMQLPWNAGTRSYYANGLEASTLLCPTDILLQIASASAIVEEAVKLRNKPQTEALGKLPFVEVKQPAPVIELSAGVRDLQKLERVDLLLLQQAAIKARNILRMNPKAQIHLRLSSSSVPIHFTFLPEKEQGADITLSDILDPVAENLSESIRYQISGNEIDEAADEYQAFLDSLSSVSHNEENDNEQNEGHERSVISPELQPEKKGFLQRMMGGLSSDDIRYIVDNPQNYVHDNSPTRGWTPPVDSIKLSPTSGLIENPVKVGLSGRAWDAIKRSHDRSLGLSDKEMGGLTKEEKERKRQEARQKISDEYEQKILDDARRKRQLQDEEVQEKQLADVKANITAYGGDITGLRADMSLEELRAEQKRRIADAHKQSDELRKRKSVPPVTNDNTQQNQSYADPEPQKSIITDSSSSQSPSSDRDNHKPGFWGSLLGAATGSFRKKHKSKDAGIENVSSAVDSYDLSEQPEKLTSSISPSVSPKQESQLQTEKQFIDYGEWGKPMESKQSELVESKLQQQPKPDKQDTSQAKSISQDKFKLEKKLLEGQAIQSPTLDQLKEKYMKVSDVGETLSETDPGGAELIKRQLARIQGDIMKEYAKQQNAMKKGEE